MLLDLVYNEFGFVMQTHLHYIYLLVASLGASIHLPRGFSVELEKNPVVGFDVLSNVERGL